MGKRRGRTRRFSRWAGAWTLKPTTAGEGVSPAASSVIDGVRGDSESEGGERKSSAAVTSSRLGPGATSRRPWDERSRQHRRGSDGGAESAFRVVPRPSANRDRAGFAASGAAVGVGVGGD